MADLSEAKHNSMAEEGIEIATQLCEIGREFYQLGWVLGTSGNFSTVLERQPLRLAITASGVDKGALTANEILQIDSSGAVIEGKGKPSAETSLHLVIVQLLGANAVLHTHSVWSSIVSDSFATDSGVKIEDYEMLKGLQGVTTHQHTEWLPIIENSQDYTQLSQTVATILKEHPDAHGFILRRHGLYTWGEDLRAAKRHVEILEFLLEATGRRLALK
jgi:methylthioribulose-1-phosphate dehydratase